MNRILMVAAESLAFFALSACGGHNNRLLGRVHETVGGHLVMVTDCYRIVAPRPETFVEGSKTIYRYTPCRDADVVIRDENLIVNGRAYGRLNDADAVLVDHGIVSVQRK
jgi:hypothetical protein